jgi:hypothetical protein
MKERLQILVIALPAMGSMAVTGRLAVSFVWAILGIGLPLPSPAAHARRFGQMIPTAGILPVCLQPRTATMLGCSTWSSFNRLVCGHIAGSLVP